VLAGKKRQSRATEVVGQACASIRRSASRQIFRIWGDPADMATTWRRGFHRLTILISGMGLASLGFLAWLPDWPIGLAILFAGVLLAATWGFYGAAVWVTTAFGRTGQLDWRACAAVALLCAVMIGVGWTLLSLPQQGVPQAQHQPSLPEPPAIEEFFADDPVSMAETFLRSETFLSLSRRDQQGVL
jgi:hypothetical protein